MNYQQNNFYETEEEDVPKFESSPLDNYEVEFNEVNIPNANETIHTEDWTQTIVDEPGGL